MFNSQKQIACKALCYCEILYPQITGDYVCYSVVRFFFFLVVAHVRYMRVFVRFRIDVFERDFVAERVHGV